MLLLPKGAGNFFFHHPDGSENKLVSDISLLLNSIIS